MGVPYLQWSFETENSQIGCVMYCDIFAVNKFKKKYNCWIYILF